MRKLNQEKIGQFIATCRKRKHITQLQLAEHMGISDKAVSKWERGKSMPDLSLFMPLCALLDITLNELLLGEYIPDDKIKEKSNQVLMDVITNWIGNDFSNSTLSDYEVPCVLKLEHIKKVYTSESTSTTAVNDISFEVHKGSFIGIMGASGSGKSTLLNMIATIDKVTDGRIEIDGLDIGDLSDNELADFRKGSLGFVFQEYNLLKTLTIYENIALALTIKEEAKDKVKSIILEVATNLEIVDILAKYPYEVSGGQRQRCACARAIAMNPSLILADEPTGALDSHSTRQLLETFLFLRKAYGATILMVTHDALSASYCDEILFLEDGMIQGCLKREQKSKQSFFTAILDTIAQIEGANACVF